jgi:phosphoglycolate phosphatase
MYDLILFDLDGTLTDPAEGITNSVRHALAKRGIFVSDRTALYKFIGPPLIDSFMQFYGYTHAEAVQGVEDYREYYADRGIWENKVYPGIPELLADLKAVREGRLYCTGMNMFQQVTGTCTMIRDFYTILREEDSDDSKLTYLRKLS